MAGTLLLEKSGGRLLVFQHTLPTVGPLKLQQRDDVRKLAELIGAARHAVVSTHQQIVVEAKLPPEVTAGDEIAAPLVVTLAPPGDADARATAHLPSLILESDSPEDPVRRGEANW